MAAEHSLTTMVWILLAFASFGAWLGHRGRPEGMPIAVVSLFFAILTVAVNGAAGLDRQRNEEFAERKERIIELMGARFDLSCDRLGLTKGDRLNCFERNGFRVWREDGKLYAANLSRSTPSIDLIVDEDRLLGGSHDSIIYLYPTLDLDLLVRLAKAEL